MKISELLNEAHVDKRLRFLLSQKGYKFLGSGQDQDVFLAPDGSILKIFGYDRTKESNGFTVAQQSFIDFATYCQNNSSNVFLPDFSGWKKFEYNGEQYLQINCERLFELTSNVDSEIKMLLERCARLVKGYGAKEALEILLSDSETNTYNEINQLILLLGGENTFKLFLKTLEDLYNIAQSKDYIFDLHAGNFMLGSDGNLVINDPFFTGSFRSNSSYSYGNDSENEISDRLSDTF